MHNIVLDLPYDVLQHIFAHATPVDTLRFISCSRKLYYSLIDDDSTWRRFCAPYGIEDTGSFSRRSFRTIYGRLLHPYGPLLGFWCSDYPFKGNIIQFRLLPDNWQRNGESIICGDVWKFATESIHPPPHHPAYIEFIQIGFTPLDKATPDTINDVRISWHIRTRQDFGFSANNGPSVQYHMDGDERSQPSLHVIAPNTLTVQLTNFFARPVFSPEFPPSLTAPWYDTERTVPRLPQEEPPPIVLPPVWPFRHTVGDVRYVESAMKPASISFFPPANANAADYTLLLHAPMHPLSGPFAAVRPRYYPLRTVGRVNVDPHARDWSAGSLEGLWLGDYGPHGTECVFIEHDAAAAQLRAWKITGDPNVPRGVCTWQAYLQGETACEDPVGSGVREFRGYGRTAQHGYM